MQTHIVVVDKVPNRSNVVLQFLRERKRFAYQSPNPLSKRVIETLNVSSHRQLDIR
jgi:hypothetical protein